MIAGIAHLPLIQAGLQSLRAGIASSQPSDDLLANFQELYEQAKNLPTVRPALRGFACPNFVGSPTHDDLRAMADSFEALLTPAPIRRNDPIAQNSHSWVERAAIRQGAKKTSYKTLDQRADILGTFLATSLRDRGDRVATFFGGNRNHVFEISLACRRAGVAFTNFHSYMAADKFIEQVDQSRYRILFLDSESLVKVEPLLPLLDELGCTVIDIDSRYRSAVPYGSLFINAPRPMAQTPDDRPPAYPGPVMYSSGTTGHPKLISVKATSKVGAAANKLFRIREDDKNLVVGQLYHGGAYSWAKGHLNRGAEVVLLQHSSLSLNPEEVLSEIAKREITNFWISPTWLQGLCDYVERTSKKPDVSSLRAIYVGASHFHPAVKRQAERTFGPIIWENYATTEVGLISILRPKELLEKPTTVGRVAPGVEVEIRDEGGSAVPVGTPGTIFVKNELTDGAFRQGDDFGKLDEDGFLTILGRTVERIIHGGKSVFPREIENELMEMPGVQECHVIGIPAESGDHLVVAAVVPKIGSRLKERAILEYLQANERLEHIKAVPKKVVIVASLPRKPYKVNHPILQDMVSRHINGQRSIR